MGASTYQSLYRRYRPQRFGDVLGQDHITVALRNAVRDGRVGHAYLFSGPRGTGKTSTARILAKVLNCADPSDGEPCGVCDNCVTVERGQVVDWLLEQDAASKSKVDDMRDLLDRVPLGTSGRRKVIILDEVHMLSQGAENALLKTLEEPPDHVIFVLATTDPQKVRETIRSRTQHFPFHLVSPDLMADHVRYVIADAGLTLEDPEAAVAHVVAAGGGSVRDTLSALDQVAALGQVVSHRQSVDAILDAVVAQDAGGALVAVADLMATGRDPRGLGETLIGRLRDSFLALMGVADEHLPPAERAGAQVLGEKFGAPGLTRALDVLGEALTELSRKPDPRVVLEVALVRLARPDTDRNLDAVLERLSRLEQAVQSGGGVGGGDSGAAAPQGKAAASASAAPGAATGSPRQAEEAEPRGTSTPGPAGAEKPDGPASAARAALAQQQQKKRKSNPTGTPRPSAAATPPSAGSSAPAPAAPAAATEPTAASATSTPASGAGGSGPDVDVLAKVWADELLARLDVRVRSKWRGGRWIDGAGDTVRFAVPNRWHLQACEPGRLDVERLLVERFGQRLTVQLVDDEASGGGGGGATPQPGGQPTGTASGDHHDPEDVPHPAEVADLPDADDVTTGGVDLLMREFGGELVKDDKESPQ